MSRSEAASAQCRSSSATTSGRASVRARSQATQASREHVGHRRRVGARGAELRRRSVGRRVDTGDLAEAGHDAIDVGSGDDALDHRAELARSGWLGVGAADPRASLDQLSGEAERRRPADGLGAGEDDVGDEARADARRELLEQARFADPGRRDDQYRA